MAKLQIQGTQGKGRSKTDKHHWVHRKDAAPDLNVLQQKVRAHAASYNHTYCTGHLPVRFGLAACVDVPKRSFNTDKWAAEIHKMMLCQC